MRHAKLFLSLIAFSFLPGSSLFAQSNFNSPSDPNSVQESATPNLSVDPFGSLSVDPFGAGESVKATEASAKIPSTQGLSETGRQHQQMREILETPMSLDFDEVPWSDVETLLESRLGFQIFLTHSARDDSLAEDDPVRFKIDDLAAKHALRLMLFNKNATYVLQDGVLKIISKDDEEDSRNFARRVFNVRSLLAMIEKLEADRIGLPRIRDSGGGQFGGVVPVVGQRGTGGGMFAAPNQASEIPIKNIWIAEKNLDDAARANSEGEASVQTCACKNQGGQPVELITAESLLIDLIQSTFHSDSWLDNGSGLGEISIIGGCVVVNSTSKITDELEDFLQDLEFKLAE